MRKSVGSTRVKRAAKGDERRAGDNSNDWRDGMRVGRFMILKPSEEEQATWRGVSQELQRMYNRLVVEWHMAHLARGNDVKVREWLKERSEYGGRERACFEKLWDEWKEKNPDLATLKKSMSQKDRGKRDKQKKKIKAAVLKEIGKAPKCPVFCWGLPREAEKGEKQLKIGDIQHDVYEAVRATYTVVHTQAWSQAWQGWPQNFAKQKASNRYNDEVPGWAKRWHLILADLGGGPSFNSTTGIPMHPGKFDIIPPTEEEIEAVFQEKLELWLQEEDNAALEGPAREEAMKELQGAAKATVVWYIGFRAAKGEGRSAGVYHRVRLATQGYGRRDLRFTLEAIQDGTRKKKGSALFEQKPGKWYFHLGYQELKMARATVNRQKKVVLEPGITVPWLLLHHSEERWIMGRGGAVTNFRKILAFKRKTFSASYQHGKRRGHGNKKRRPLFRNVMDGFKDDFDKKTARKVLEWAIAHGCGKIVYRRPVDDWASKPTFLASSGAEVHGDNSWPWERISVLLGRLCEEYGLLFVEERYYPPKKKCKKCGKEKIVVRFSEDFARKDNRVSICKVCEGKEVEPIEEVQEKGKPVGMKGIPEGDPGNGQEGSPRKAHVRAQGNSRQKKKRRRTRSRS